MTKQPVRVWCSQCCHKCPPERLWEGLTEEEIDVLDNANWDIDHKSWGIYDFAKALEAKLKEKNT
jgi:hypothetical protein